MSEVDYLQLLEGLLRKYKPRFKGRLIFGFLSGSKSFNLAVESSDDDYWGVFVAPIEDVLSIYPLRDVYEHFEPDFVVNEVEKYCETLLKGNPIEPLFAVRFFSQTKEWEQLKQFRNFVLTQNTVDQYLRYACFQYAKAQKKDPGTPTTNFKPYYHAFHILFEAEQIALGNRPIIWFEGEKREFLLSIRNGKINEKNLEELFNEKKNQVEEIKGNIPEKIDITQLNQWLVGIRLAPLLLQRIEDDTFLDVVHNNEPLSQKCKHLLDISKVTGRIICCVPAGSRCYGLEIPNSSFDYVGIYVAPTSSVVSLTKPPPRLCELADSTVGDTYVRHLVLFELSSACSLLVAGNHRLIEALFLEDQPNDGHSLATKAWLHLKTSKQLFLSATAVQHYVGFSNGQLKSQNSNIYQALRLTLEAERISQGEPPRIKFEGEDRAFLMAVREGSASNQARNTVQQKNKQILANKASWKVPSKCQASETLNKWQFNLRKTYLN